MMRRDKNHFSSGVVIAVVISMISAGCAGIQTAATGVGLLVLSPLMIAGGISQGLAFLPYTLTTDLDRLNQGLKESQATTLNEAYRSAYGVSIEDGRVNRQTGEIRGEDRPFRTMMEATQALQKLLADKGMTPEKASHYVVCSIDSHTRSRGHILVSVVYRHPGMQPIRVTHKHTGIVTTLRPEQSAWREPYEKSVDGETIDEIVDWAGFEYGLLGSHKVVGMLMVTAVESIQAGKRSDDYWGAERRWISGETGQIIEETKKKGMEAIQRKT